MQEYPLTFAPQPWEGSSAGFALTISGYKYPETTTWEYGKFIKELNRVLLEKEVAVRGDRFWEWPKGEFTFTSNDKIILVLEQEPDALRPLTLGQTMEISALLEEWGKSKPDIGLVPSARSLKISITRATDLLLTTGNITMYMPEYRDEGFPNPIIVSRDLKRNNEATTPAISVPLDPSDYRYGDHLVRFSLYSEPSSNEPEFTALISDLDKQINTNLRRAGLYSAPWPQPHATCMTGSLRFQLSPAPLEDELDIAIVDTVSSAMHAWSFGFGQHERPLTRIEVFNVEQQEMGPVAVGGVGRVGSFNVDPSASRVAVA